MAKQHLGLVHVYSGLGKGKTSASMGLVLRAVGQGLKVYIIQFMKGGAYTGELISAKNFLPSVNFVQYGKPCVKEDKQIKLMGFDSGYTYFDYVRDNIDCGSCRDCFLNDEEQKKFVEDAFQKAKKVSFSGDYDMVVLDESIVAVAFKLLPLGEVIELIEEKPPAVELILTGRKAPPEFVERADLVTECLKIKHPYDGGVRARRGVDY